MREICDFCRDEVAEITLSDNYEICSECFNKKFSKKGEDLKDDNF